MICRYAMLLLVFMSINEWPGRYIKFLKCQYLSILNIVMLLHSVYIAIATTILTTLTFMSLIVNRQPVSTMSKQPPVESM